MLLARRSFLTGLIAAPVVIAYDRLMPVKPVLWTPRAINLSYSVEMIDELKRMGLDVEEELAKCLSEEIQEAIKAEQAQIRFTQIVGAEHRTPQEQHLVEYAEGRIEGRATGPGYEEYYEKLRTKVRTRPEYHAAVKKSSVYATYDPFA